MFHDHRSLRPETVSAPAFALAAADLIKGSVMRLTGGTDEGAEVDIAFAAIQGGIAYDQDGPHEKDAWMTAAADLAGHGDFWCYGIMTAPEVETLRQSLPAEDMETARLMAVAVLLQSGMQLKPGKTKADRITQAADR